MKRLDQALAIGPMYLAEFERAGIRTVRDLATVESLPEVSGRTGIPLDLVQQWHEQAKAKIRASRYRRRVAIGIVAVALAILGWLLVAYLRSPDRISAQADAALDSGENARALALYDKVIRLAPQNRFAYANRAEALRRLSRTDEALASINKALDFDPSDVWVYNERGNIYFDLEQYDRAIQDYEKAVQLDPNYKFAYGGKGLALEALKRYEEALVPLNKAIELDPEYAWGYNERGDVYTDLQQYEPALKDYDKTIALSPKYRVAYGSRGFALSRLGRYEDAVEAFTKELALDPDNAWAYAERGGIRHDHLDQFEPAYQDLKKAFEQSPTHLGYGADLAEAALTSGRFDEANDLAGKILAETADKDEKEFSVSSRLSMRFVVIAALLLKGRTAEVKTKLDEFVAYARSVGPKYDRTWNYGGTLHYMQGRAMDRTSKDLILGLLKFLDRPPHLTIDRIQELGSALR